MNKNKSIPYVIGAIIIIIGLIIIFTQKSSAPTPTPSTNSETTVTDTTTGSSTATPSTSTTGSTSVSATVSSIPGSYTLAEVAKHNSASNCWTAVNGGVYNVTSWIAEHPGGSKAIIGLCGIDGSSAFNGQHGGQRQPESELASFKIGTLK